MYEGWCFELIKDLNAREVPQDDRGEQGRADRYTMFTKIKRMVVSENANQQVKMVSEYLLFNYTQMFNNFAVNNLKKKH